MERQTASSQFDRVILICLVAIYSVILTFDSYGQREYWDYDDLVRNGYDYRDGQIYKDSTCKILLKIKEDYKSSTIILSENVENIYDYAIQNVKNLETLIIPNKNPVRLTWIDHSAIYGNPNLREIIFGGILNTGYRGGQFRIYNNPKLEKLTIGEGQKELGPYSIESFSKVSLPTSLEILDSHAFYGDIMFLNLPNVKNIYYAALGGTRNILFGDKIEMIYSIWFNPFECKPDESRKKVNRTICCTAMTPPKVNDFYGIPGPFPTWKIYVPKDAVNNYKKDPYWGNLAKIYPITDQLIPIISEEKILMEEGETEELLWDVMPMGKCVPEDSGVWASDDPDIASIDQEGLLTAHLPGRTRISFTIRDQNGKQFTEYCPVTVTIPGAVNDINDDADIPSSSPTSIPDGIYNLHGQRISGTIEGLPSGLYIRVTSGHPEKILK